MQRKMPEMPKLKTLLIRSNYSSIPYYKLASYPPIPGHVLEICR